MDSNATRAEREIERARTLQAQGRLPEARQHCERALQLQPAHFVGLNLAGILAAQSNCPAEAAERFSQALQISPRSAQVHCNLGNALMALGSFSAAAESYERTLNIEPASALAHCRRGDALLQLGRFAQAADSYDRAIALQSNYLAALNNRGAALRGLDRSGDALLSFEAATAIDPNFPEAHNNRGLALSDLKRHDEAVASFARALSLRPDDADAWNNQASALFELGRFAEAVASCDRALKIEPRSALAHCRRGDALFQLGRFAEAVDSYDRAIDLQSDYAAAFNNRGAALRALDRFADALLSFEAATAIDPDFSKAHSNRGLSLVDLKRHDEAVASFARALNLRPDDAEAWNNQASALIELRRYPEAAACYDSAMALNDQIEWLPGARLHARMHLCAWGGFEAERAALAAGIEAGQAVADPLVAAALLDSPALQRLAAQTRVRQSYPPSDELPPLARLSDHARIRVGYFSPDFRDHVLMNLAAGLFEMHDRSRFELTAFSFGPDNQDESRKRATRAFDSFIDVSGMSDRAVALLARELEIDIAVDLAGFTAGCRPKIFAMRAAPLQISYLGYLGTMSAEYIDYLIADHTIVPETHRQFYAEKILYLPSYQVNDCNRRPADASITRQELGLPSKGFVFCCFNAAYKITPDVYAAWMRILNTVDDSVLLLLGDNEVVQRNLKEEAVRHGIEVSRLVFAVRVPFREYLARYRLADLFLDTLPYNAGATASDALWAGLPVLTCMGNTFAGRVGASLLRAVGLPELVTVTQARYEELAVELARDPERLAGLRSRLAANRLTTRLFDLRSFTHHLEASYINIYERCRAGHPPEHADL